MAVKRMRVRKSSRAKRSVQSKKLTPWSGRIEVRAIALAAVFIVAAGILIAGYKPSGPPAIAAVEAKSESSAPVAMIAETTAVSEPAATPAAAAPVPVTITGCLERDDETFKLKDTSGNAVPRSRSWKTGFLKKGSASIEVVGGDRNLNLASHVGQRVSVTGTLVDREMKVRSMRRVAASCSTNQKVKI